MRLQKIPEYKIIKNWYHTTILLNYNNITSSSNINLLTDDSYYYKYPGFHFNKFSEKYKENVEWCEENFKHDWFIDNYVIYIENEQDYNNYIIAWNTEEI